MQVSSSLSQRIFKLHWLAFFCLLACTAYLRHFGFYLPSYGGDSSAYMANAMKLEHGFMRHYDIFHYAMVPRGKTGLVDYVWEDDPKKWNANRIRSIYHRPLHMQPPLYPVLIWLSHGVFKTSGPYTSVQSNLGSQLKQHRPPEYLKEQGYAVGIPFVFSLLTLFWVYLFCLKFFSPWEGLLAVLILVGNPLEIAVGSRVYADGILTSLTFLSLFLFFLSLESSCRNPKLLATAAGVVLGLSFLTKFTGVFFAAAFPIALLLAPLPKSGWRRLLDARLFWAGLAAFITALPWNLLVYHHYATFLPNTPWSDNPWFRWVFNRPWYLYPAGLVVFATPLLSTSHSFSYGLSFFDSAFCADLHPLGWPGKPLPTPTLSLAGYFSGVGNRKPMQSTALEMEPIAFLQPYPHRLRDFYLGYSSGGAFSRLSQSRSFKFMGKIKSSSHLKRLLSFYKGGFL